MIPLADHMVRYIETKQRLGYRYANHAKILRSFAKSAGNDEFICSQAVLAWASEGISRYSRVRRLRVVHAFALWLHAEDPRHEVPAAHAFGPYPNTRSTPQLMSVEQIQTVLSAAVRLGPADTITPLTWYCLFGLIAVTGIRVGEAVRLTLDDVAPDGLFIRETKFMKSRVVALDPTAVDELNRYIKVRKQIGGTQRNLFVLNTGRPPNSTSASNVFRQLTAKTGIRDEKAGYKPTLRSLRHSFAVRSLENLAADADVNRHILALATTLGHNGVASTYWYLQSTPVLLRQIASQTE